MFVVHVSFLSMCFINYIFKIMIYLRTIINFTTIIILSIIAADNYMKNYNHHDKGDDDNNNNKGQTLNIQGECILIRQCSYQNNGMEYNAGYREIRPERINQELCTCGGGIWTRRRATLGEIKTYLKMTNIIQLCSAVKNLEATYCEPEEPRTCRNMHEFIDQYSPIICRPGCICKDGYVLNPLNGVCVEKKVCPCYHGGKAFKEGVIMQEDCNTCAYISRI